MHSFAWWPTFGVLVVAAFIDIWSRRIPNWLSLPFLVAGVGVSAVRSGLQGFEQSVAGVLLGAIVTGLLWYLRGLGMGDVKLLTAVGAWIGPSQLLFALVATGMAGGFLGVAYALWHRSLGRSLDTTADLLATLPKRGIRPHPTITLDNSAGLKIPYAPAIAIGTIFSFFS